MIPTIGIMIGCYIISRMFSLLLEKDERHICILPRILAVATILITLLCILSLLVSSGPTQ